MKQQYITPDTRIIRLLTDDNLAQFVITSKSVPESSGDAKPGYFFEEEDEYDNDPWGENEDWNAQAAPKNYRRTPTLSRKRRKSLAVGVQSMKNGKNRSS